MKTDEVEKRLKRKFEHGKSLQEQTTPEEFAEISFWSCCETEIVAEKSMINRAETDKQIEARVVEKYQKIIADSGDNYLEAINKIV